jgi:hypothetical protein
MSHRIGIGFFQNLDIVPRRHQAFDHAFVKTGFQPEIGMALSPCAAKQPARSVKRDVQWFSKHDVSRKKHRLCLRLTVATHGAVTHDATVLQYGKGRIERVERQAPRRERVCCAGIK